MKKTIYLPAIAFAFILLAWIPRMLLYPGVLKKYIGIGAAEMSIIALAAVLIWRFRHRMPEKTGSGWRIAILAASVLLQIQGAVFTFMESVTYVNFVFSTLHIQYMSVFKTGVFLFLLWTVSLPDRVWKTHLDRMLFASPFWFLAVVGVVYFWPFDYLFTLVREDMIVENAQVIMLLAGVLGSLVAGMRTRRWYRLLFFACGLALFFVAGEEISWGQRMFSISLPEFFREYNMQGDITIHNLTQVGYSPTIYAYLIISMVFFISGLVTRFVRTDTWSPILRFAIPNWTTASYFYPILLYNLLTFRGGHTIGTFAEPVELLMYAGFALYIWQRINLLGKKEFAFMRHERHS